MTLLRFRDFDKLCVRGPRAPLSAVDRFGQATGPAFKRDRRYLPKPGSSRDGGILSIRGGESLLHHGTRAKPVNMIVVTSPYVRDVRTFVPGWFAHRSPKKGNRPHVVLERVVTVERKDRPGTHHYHVITTTCPLNDRDTGDLHAMGVTVESLEPSDFSALEQENAEQCYARLHGFNVYEMALQARSMAARWCLSRRQGSMVEKLSAILDDLALEATLPAAKRGWGSDEHLLCQANLDEAVMYMFSAFVLGELVPDPRQSWDPYKKLSLLRRG